MEEILHQLIGSVSYHLQGFIHPRWWSPDFWNINSITVHLAYFTHWSPLIQPQGFHPNHMWPFAAWPHDPPCRGPFPCDESTVATGSPLFVTVSPESGFKKSKSEPQWWGWYMGVSKNMGTPKWMVYNGKPYQNGWFGGTPIFGNTHIISSTNPRGNSCFS